MRTLASALIAALIAAMAVLPARADAVVERIVTRHIQTILPADQAAGAAVVIRINGRTLFFNYGWADLANQRRVTTDTLFNLGSLRKVFEATLLAQAAHTGTLSLDDSVALHVPGLREGGDIERVTLGQLATHTSGLLLPQDHPPWPDWGYTQEEFIRRLNEWTADFDHEPGGQQIYTHAGYVLLGLALEHALNGRIDDLLEDRILHPLGMSSTSLPRRDSTPRGKLSPEHKLRAVQGYSEDGEPIGEPGDQQGYYFWSGTSQIYSSARDLAIFLAANMGELPIGGSLRTAIDLAQQGVYAMSPRNTQALAWEIVRGDEPMIIEKYGGLNNASAYIATMPDQRLGIVILSNRGNTYPNDTGRQILLALAGQGARQVRLAWSARARQVSARRP
jgi:beta-lactamase class C